MVPAFLPWDADPGQVVALASLEVPAEELVAPADRQQRRAALDRLPERLAERPYAEFAAAAGVDSIALNRAMADPATAARIAEDVALAARLGVNASGTVFFDGRRMAAWQIMDARDPSRADVAASLRLWEQLLASAPRSISEPRP